MLHYVVRTASIRKSLNSSQVFVSYGKPYKVILSATLARRLEAVLSLAGIDTSTFKGHSFRGASTSKAVSLGVPLDVILKAAGWKNAGTFAKFYQRETSLDPSQFFITLPFWCPLARPLFRVLPAQKTTCEDHMEPLYAVLICIRMIFKP